MNQTISHPDDVGPGDLWLLGPGVRADLGCRFADELDGFDEGKGKGTQAVFGQIGRRASGCECGSLTGGVAHVEQAGAVSRKHTAPVLCAEPHPGNSG